MKKKTTKDFIEEMNIKNSSIIVLGEYINARTKVLVKCKKCNYEWEALSNNLAKGGGCPICGKESFKEKKRLSKEDFIKRIFEKNPSIELLDEYENTRKRITCFCKKCNNVFSVEAQSLLTNKKNKGCPNCRENIRNTKLTKKEVVKRLKKVNPDIELISDIITTRDKAKFKCKKCGKEWEALLNNILNRHTGCPNCKESKGERKVRLFLEDHKIYFISQYRFNNCKDKYTLPFDFYLPKYNLCIEYDGKMHYIPSNFSNGEEKLKYTQTHDKIKTDYCENNNIKLLRISYLDYNNIEKILSEELKVGDA